MLTLRGTVLNVYQEPQGTKKDGTKYGGSYKVQLQGMNALRNGEKRVELVTLTTDAPEVFKPHLGAVMDVPVGVFVNDRKEMVFYLPKGASVRGE